MSDYLSLSPEAADREARCRIEQARADNASQLDLSYLPIISLPEMLGSLKELRSLNLTWCKGVTDLGPLGPLAQLRLLELSGCGGVTDLEPLGTLAQLNALNLADCRGVTDLGPLGSLTQLQSLLLSKCDGVTDLGPLGNLSQLQWLIPPKCGSVTDLGPLGSLAQLQFLNLAECSGVKDLGPLGSLAQLQSLILPSGSGITDLGPLNSLAQLRMLNLEKCCGVTDLVPLGGLAQLEWLNLSGCNGVTELGPLKALPNLKELIIRDCWSIRTLKVLQDVLPRLDRLVLYNSQFDDVYEQICGKYEFVNVRDHVIAHFREMDQESVEDAEVQLFVLGNGRVGKTQLCRRLKNKEFQSECGPTHGIKLGSFKLPLAGRSEPLSVQFWDFGGQDIYLGTHSLFLQTKHAVFVILWASEYEKSHANDDGELVINRPLTYWLDYLRATVGTNCPVLVVQGRCDETKRLLRTPPTGATGDFRYLKIVNVSAKSEKGTKAFVKELTAAMQVLLTRPFHQIGKGRFQVRKRLRALERAPNDRRERSMTLERYYEVCQDAEYAGDKDILLDFMHLTGEVFYQPGLFGNRIILDKRWALKAIYSLFNPKLRVRQLLVNSKGRFTRELLERLLWRKYPIQEQKAFLGMMLTCGICLKVQRKSRQEQQDYLAPHLLPESTDSTVQITLPARETAAASATIEYRYLHEGILRLWLSRVAEIGHDAAEYWRYGCLLAPKSNQSKLLMESKWSSASTQLQGGKITFSAWGPKADELIDCVLEISRNIATGQRSKIRRSPSLSSISMSVNQGRETEAETNSDDRPPFMQALGDYIVQYHYALLALAAIGDYCATNDTNIVSQKEIANAVTELPSTITVYLDNLENLFEKYFVEQRGYSSEPLFNDRRKGKPIHVSERGAIAILEALAYRKLWIKKNVHLTIEAE